MITLITGLPGSGKTYYLAKLAKEALTQKRPIWINFKIEPKEPYEKLVHYYNDPSMLREAEAGLILMDEAHIYFNSRKWESLDERVQYKLQQHRKDGLDIVGAVQSEARLDIVFRELVAEWKHCRKIVSSGEMSKHPWGFVIVSKFDPNDMKGAKPKRQGFPEIVRIKKENTKFYDTLQKIPIPETKGWRPAQVQVCVECGSKHYKAL